MRTNGFIFITLGFAAVSLAGTPGYLPSAGPVALRFESPARTRVMPLAAPAVKSEFGPAPLNRAEIVADLPVEPPSNPVPAPAVLMHDVPVVLPEALTGSPTNSLQLIGPMMETNGVVTPQMFLRFFTPASGGVSREAIVVPPPGFNPAQPPTPSSTATYTKPKP